MSPNPTFPMADWPKPGQSARLMLDGPAGGIECRVEMPTEPARGVAVICHPHPQFGGTMDNKVVYTLSRAALAGRWVAVRFNFRGVGTSKGGFADGIGELEDARAVAEWACQQQAGPLALAGFSFGAAIALRLSVQMETDRLVTIAPPLRYFEKETLPVPECPWLVVHGDQDDVVDCSQTLAQLEGISRQPQVQVMEGAGHFFHGRLTELRELVDPFLD